MILHIFCFDFHVAIVSFSVQNIFFKYLNSCLNPREFTESNKKFGKSMKTCIKIRENYGKLCIFISVSVLNDMHQFPLLQTSLTSKRQIELGHWIIYKRTTSIFKPAECEQTIKNHLSSSEKTSSTNSFIPMSVVFCFNSIISEENSFK